MPGTPRGMHQGPVPATPREAVSAAPSTPGIRTFAEVGRAPSTPSGGLGAFSRGVPATPAGRAPGTPSANPVGHAPGTPVAPGTPFMAMPAQSGAWAHRPGSGLSTPNQAYAPRPQPQQSLAIRQPRGPVQAQTWSDGSIIELRHAPRRKKGTAEKLPAPGTPATIPQHWLGKITPAGEKPKPVPRDEVPDFGTWKTSRLRERRKEVRVVGATLAGETPVPTQPAVPGTPGLAPMAPIVKAPDYGTFTPAEQAPFGEETPLMPRASHADATPFMTQGHATPFLPRQQDDATPFLPRHDDATPQDPGRASQPFELTAPYEMVPGGNAVPGGSWKESPQVLDGNETPLTGQSCRPEKTHIGL